MTNGKLNGKEMKRLEEEEEEVLLDDLNDLHDENDDDLDDYDLPPISDYAKHSDLFPSKMLTISKRSFKGSQKSFTLEEIKQNEFDILENIYHPILSSTVLIEDEPNLPKYMDVEKPLGWIENLMYDLTLDDKCISDYTNSDSNSIDILVPRTSKRWPTGQLDKFKEKSNLTLLVTQNLLLNIQKKKNLKHRNLILKKRKMVKYKAHTLDCYDVLPMKRFTSSQLPFSIGSDDFISDSYFEYQKFKNSVSDFYRHAEAANDTNIKYRLPIDLNTLVGLTVSEYLLAYCQIAPDQNAIYTKLFNETQLSDRLDGGSLAIHDKVNDLLLDCMNEAQLSEFLNILDLPRNLSIEASSFCMAMGLADRLFGQDTMDYNSQYQMQQSDVLERLDFNNIARKLDGLDINPKLVNLLIMLEATGFDQTKGVEPKKIKDNDISSKESINISTRS